MADILIVDDDPHILEVLRFALQQAGHTLREATDGRQALRAFGKRAPDLIVLDIIMPEADGLDVCRQIRQSSRVPILFLSSRDEELDRILGLELGGDDYLTKPFSPRELVARVKALLRRSLPPPADSAAAKAIVCHGPLRLDPARHECLWHGKTVTLTATEFSLLYTLAKRPGRVFSRADLVARAYEEPHVVTERTVDSHVRRLRSKLSGDAGEPIETVYGVGYRLREAM